MKFLAIDTAGDEGQEIEVSTYDCIEDMYEVYGMREESRVNVHLDSLCVNSHGSVWMDNYGYISFQDAVEGKLDNNLKRHIAEALIPLKSGRIMLNLNVTDLPALFPNLKEVFETELRSKAEKLKKLQEVKERKALERKIAKAKKILEESGSPL